MEISTQSLKAFLKTKWKILLAVFILLPILFVFLLFLSVRFGMVGTLPTHDELMQIRTPEASELYAADGTMIGKYFVENRSNLSYEQINPHFIDALLATEDKRFYKHSGVDYRSLFRVFIKTIILRNKSSGGGSTLTQQLAKNTYKRERFAVLSTVINKFREFVLAGRLENIYSKKEILELYCNTVSFGERAFGLEIASQRFYSKASIELNIEQTATLVGILKAPTYYSPRKNPERALGRRNVVLSLMLQSSKITQEQFDSFKQLELSTAYSTPITKYEFAKYFKEEVKNEFRKINNSLKKQDGSNYSLFEDGLKIYTSLDIELQIAAEKNMKLHMVKLQKAFEDNWASANMYGSKDYILNEYIEKHPKYKSLIQSGLSKKEAVAELEKDRSAFLWTWDGYEKTEHSVVDSIKHYLSMLHCSVLAADPNTGFVKVWIGGNDHGTFQIDNVKAGRQVGSTFKPIVYMTALESGTDPCKKYANEKRIYSDYDDWTPRNANDEYGDSLSMYDAITQSVNTVSVQVLFEAGIPRVVKKARSLGIESKLAEYPSIVLGTSDVSLNEMVNAYSHFANGGKSVDLHTILKIENKEGDIVYQHEEVEAEQVLDTTHVNVLNGMLYNVVQNGTARRLHGQFNIPYQIAGKTGTTQNQTDGWFIGYSPDLVVGAWVGTEDRRIHFKSLGLGAGSNTALPLAGPIFEFASFKNLLASHDQFSKFSMEDCQPKIDPLAEWRERAKSKILMQFPKRRDNRVETPYYKRQDKKQRESASRKRRNEVEKEKKKLVKTLEGLFKKKKKRRK